MAEFAPKPTQPSNQPLKSFRELKAAYQDREKSEYLILFEKLLKGRVDRVVPGKIDSSEELKKAGINYFVVNPFIDQTHGQPSAYSTVTAVLDQGTAMFRIDEQGELSSPSWPKQLSFSREKVAAEYLKITELVGTDFWTMVPEGILDEQSEERYSEESELHRLLHEKPLNPDKRYPPDPKRIGFFETQSKVLFGLVNEEEGFNDYRVFVFPNFIVFENPAYGNATFIVNLDQPILVNPDVYKFPPNKRLSDHRREEIIDQHLRPILGVKTKTELREFFDTLRIIHVPDQSKWKERMQQEIDQRTTP